MHFIIVLENEVVGEIPIPMIKNDDGVLHPEIEKIVAILSSDPKIVASETPIEKGSTWDGTSFTPPVE